MKLSAARIGYDGYSEDLSGPGDRRRFCAYATHRHLAFDRAAIDRDYDVVLVTHNGDIPGWTRRKLREGDRLKLVFELVDAYFEQTSPARRFAKGVLRYTRGTDSRLSPDFRRTLIRACEAADSVICSTEEQRATIRRYNPNVTISFDYFGNELGAPKSDYRLGQRLKVVWEGQFTTVTNLLAIKDALNAVRDRIELHVVTDPMYRRFIVSRWRPTVDLLREIECPIVLHPWEQQSFSDHVTACDLAIIPIDARNRLWWGKPENKLVLLWQLGMPVLTSATSPYRRAMAGAGVGMLSETVSDWRDSIERTLASDAAELEAIGRRCKAYADRIYSREVFARRFDEAFAAAGFSVD